VKNNRKWWKGKETMEHGDDKYGLREIKLGK